MKIERISENQIRCTLTSFDLSVRNLNLGELAYGNEKARNLFREMIQKASNEVGFDADDIPLMVEAIPLSNESVMLVITKIEDPEELDTRFSKFSPASDEEDRFLNELASELLEGAESFFAMKKQAETETVSEPEEKVSPLPAKPKNPASQMRMYSFDSLDLITDAARIVGHVFDGRNSLYKKPENGRYYLVLSNGGTDTVEFSRICNILAEYGLKLRHEYHSTEAYFKEHYETIIKEQALQKLSAL